MTYLRPSISNAIRMQVIRGNAKKITALIINKNQVAILKLIGSGETTSRELAAHLDISVPNASSKLERLRKAGYLTREMVSDPTGGNIGLYECIPVCLN